MIKGLTDHCQGRRASDWLEKDAGQGGLKSFSGAGSLFLLGPWVALSISNQSKHWKRHESEVKQASDLWMDVDL